jgi:CubicO group peptidase (beta-lactamase class C family)
MSGQTWSSARDFARSGLLYMNDGVWLGERILPEGWVKYVTTRGPAQPARAPFYGAQFWLHGGMSGLPDDAFTPSGGQGHYAMVIPSRKVVIVRRGFDTGAGFDIDRFSADVLKAIGRP